MSDYCNYNTESDTRILDMIGYKVDDIMRLCGYFTSESSKEKAKQIIARLENI